MLSGLSLFAFWSSESHSGRRWRDLSVKMPGYHHRFRKLVHYMVLLGRTSVDNCLEGDRRNLLIRIGQDREQVSQLTWATWMSCFPNSLDKLWDKALKPNFPAANALVVTLPLKLAVAPVKIKVPRAPFARSISLSMNVLIAFREKENAASMLICKDSLTSSGVISRKGFQMPWPVFHMATVMTYLSLEKLRRMSCHVDSSCSSE